MTCTNPARERQINERLEAIHRRLKWIADTEANAARCGRSEGRFDQERSKLIAETDILLDQLAAIGGSPAFRPPPE